MIIKICKICKKEFIPNSNVQKYCSKTCYLINQKIYLKQYKRKYTIEQKQKHLIQIKKYQQEHKEEIKERRKPYIKKYRDEHKEQRNLYSRKYYKLHKEKIKKQSYENIKNRLKTDINFRLLHCLRKRIWTVLKQNKKLTHTIELIGCSIEFLKQHLENQFTEGMSWSNYGLKGWHVDHIHPCKSFDLTKLENQLKCFNYTNLQPLWAIDNLKKGAKIYG